jgi:hypothetical protein
MPRPAGDFTRLRGKEVVDTSISPQFEDIEYDQRQARVPTESNIPCGKFYVTIWFAVLNTVVVETRTPTPSVSRAPWHFLPNI